MLLKILEWSFVSLLCSTVLTFLTAAVMGFTFKETVTLFIESQKLWFRPSFW